ncbi:CD63 protein, partial [Acromyrmex charruanus]
MVVTFACLLLTILIIQVAISIYVFVVVKNSGEIDFENIYRTNLFMKYDNQEEKNFVNTIQDGLQCCGIHNPQDFPTLLHGTPIPGSCCGKVASDTCDPTESYRTGCVEALEDFFNSALTVLGGVALGIAATELQCCGIHNPQDFPTLLHGTPIPGSCCGKVASDTCDPTESYRTGCVEALEDFFNSALTVLGGVALGIAATELIGIIFALCLANSIKNTERRGYSV